MKQLLPPLLVLALLAGISAANARALAQSTEAWASLAEEAAVSAEADDYDAVRETVASLGRAWEARQTLLRVTVCHDTLDDLALTLASLHRAAAEEDIDAIRESAAIFRLQLRLLREAEAFSLRNIL